MELTPAGEQTVLVDEVVGEANTDFLQDWAEGRERRPSTYPENVLAAYAHAVVMVLTKRFNEHYRFQPYVFVTDERPVPSVCLLYELAREPGDAIVFGSCKSPLVININAEHFLSEAASGERTVEEMLARLRQTVGHECVSDEVHTQEFRKLVESLPYDVVYARWVHYSLHAGLKDCKHRFCTDLDEAVSKLAIKFCFGRKQSVGGGGRKRLRPVAGSEVD